jgi:chorismate synthase
VVASIVRMVTMRRDPGFRSMANDVTKDEFTHLEVRVRVVEHEVEGEKLVTRHVFEQTRRNSDDLAAIKRRLDGLDQKIDGVESRLGNKIDSLGAKFHVLTTNLPVIVGDVVREVFRESDDKR